MRFRLPFGPSQDAHLDGELLSAYLDGQVKPDERRRVETHLGTCPACQSELASLRQTVTMLHALPRVPAPRAFTLSEVQVGLRRPASAGTQIWFGGMARGLVAVSAVALVAVMAAALLRQPSWQPSQNIAQLAAPAPAAEAPTADAVIARVEPTDTAKAPKAAGASGAPVTAQALQALAATKAPAPAAASLAAGTQIAKLPEKPAEKPVTAIVEAQSAAAKAQADQPGPPSAAAAVPVTPLPTDRPAAGAAALAAAAAPPVAAPTATLAVARAASGPALTAAAAAKSGGTPPALSAAAPAPALAELPSEASLVYADVRGLWAVDRATGATGVRPLVQAEGVIAPAISSDRSWVAYRLVKGGNNEVWAVPSSGGAARLLLAERDLSGGLPQGYRERRIQDVRWLPGRQMLLVTAQLTPVAQDAAPQLEMWTIDIASGARKLLATGDARQRPVVAPNGAQIAFFRLAPEKASEGSLWLIGADDGGERAALRFPVRPDMRSFDGQIAWLPDSSGLWAAIPDAGQPNALTLYRVPLTGEAQPAGRVDGQEAFWSPNGTRLAYTGLTGEATGPRELVLAAADGANPQLVATIPNGRFIGWSPDSARFLYEDGDQLFVGTPGGKTQRLAAGAIEPRWLGPSQIVYQAGPGDTRQLIIQAVDGKAVPLQTLPAGATVDSIRP